MPFFGAHLSVAAGYEELFLAADEIGCEAVQIFAKNQRQWESKPIENGASESFRKARAASKVRYVNIHASYLLNLLSPDPELLNRSVASLMDDMKRGKELGIEDTVIHPGSHLGSGESEGIKRITHALNLIFERTDFGNVLLETTAGQGTSVGWKFEHLRDIISGIKRQERIFVCYDTCHTFSAGYDLRNKEEYDKTFASFDSTVGIEKLRLFHLNDSKNDIGSRKDRHEFIGRGYIGATAFSFLVNDKRFSELPMVLEVPGDYSDFVREIKLLRRMRKR